MKSPFKILIIVLGILLFPFFGLFVWSLIDPPLEWGPFPPPPPTDVAFCVDRIERVRVVNMIPGNLNKPIKIEETNPEFVKKASFLLDEFWDGEVVVVTTSNYGSALALSQREIAIVLSQRPDGEWNYSANIYDELGLIPTLEFTAPRKNKIDVVVEDINTKVVFNETYNVAQVSMDKEQNFRRYPFGKYEPELFLRSLKDIFDGRCDRIMSSAIMGPKSKQKTGLPMGDI